MNEAEKELEDMEEQNRMRVRLHNKWKKKADQSDKIVKKMVKIITKEHQEKPTLKEKETYDGLLLNDNYEFDLDDFVNAEVEKSGAEPSC